MTGLALPHSGTDETSATYEVYRDFLTRVICRKFNVPEDDALELVHEVFISYIRCRNEVSNHRSWLLAAACNAARGYWRRHTDNLEESAAAEARAPGINIEVAARVAEVLRQLPPRWRRILELHYLEGHSTVEMAQILDTTPGYAEKLVHEGLVRARALGKRKTCT